MRVLVRLTGHKLPFDDEKVLVDETRIVEVQDDDHEPAECFFNHISPVNSNSGLTFEIEVEPLED